ncbi:MAG: hypothetical protein JO015_14355 [Verrucomicrobia bacterium]|nr:hypothetical protein [Verrucomicrobiota bacterium]
MKKFLALITPALRLSHRAGADAAPYGACVISPPAIPVCRFPSRKFFLLATGVGPEHGHGLIVDFAR